MLRVILFLGTNLAIMLVLGIVVSLFGIDRWAYSHTGMNLQGMLVLCAVFGMGGAFISLAMSKCRVPPGWSGGTENWFTQ